MWWGWVVMGVGGLRGIRGEIGDVLLWLKDCLVVGEVEVGLEEDVVVLVVPTLGR